MAGEERNHARVGVIALGMLPHGDFKMVGLDLLKCFLARPGGNFGMDVTHLVFFTRDEFKRNGINTMADVLWGKALARKDMPQVPATARA